jgi:predicted aspartyl protease
MSFEYETVEDLTYEGDGHYHLQVPAFYERGSYANCSIDFVFDTGAFITVVSRETAKRLKFLDTHTIMKDIQLDGFTGGCLADIKETPGFLIGGKFIDGAKVAVPHKIRT